MEERDIQRLLRLKRFETPGPEYFERFAEDFRKRQRAELLRQPLWKIALDRVGAFFDAPFAARPAYAFASAAVLALASIYSFSFLSEPAPDRLASAPTTSDARSARAALTAQASIPSGTAVSAPHAPVFADLSSGSSPVALDAAPRAARYPAAALRQPDARPHYVIDARPASYDLADSF